MSEEVVERFTVETETGARYTILLIQEYRSGAGGRIPALRRYDVQGGGHANYIDDDTVRIVATNELARRVA
ncbi:hypothetical protein [Caulobacter segnis]